MDYRNTLDLRRHPDLAALFPIDSDMMLAISEDMSTNGFDESTPIILCTGEWAIHKNYDGTTETVEYILDGHTRADAASWADIRKVPVVLKEFLTLEDAAGYAIKLQKFRRNLTKKEIYNCVARLLSMKKEWGAWRGNQYVKSDDFGMSPRGDLPKNEENCATPVGRYSYIIADIVGVGHTTVERVDFIERSGNKEIRDKVANGEMSIKTGYDLLRGRVPRSERTQKRAEVVVADGCPSLIEAVEKGDLSISGAAEIAKLPRDTQEELVRTMRPVDAVAQAKGLNEQSVKYNVDLQNLVEETQAEELRVFTRTRGEARLADWVWNPITGCDYGCNYCYARWEAHVHYANAIQEPEMRFRPRIRREMLSAPYSSHPPTNETDSSNKVITCDMGDMLCHTVPSEWILDVIKSMGQNDHWTFLVTTRNPTRYIEFGWPQNVWLGASACDQRAYENAVEVFKDIRSNLRFLQMEPLLEEIQIEAGYDLFDWVIIGPRRRTPTVAALQPKWEWVWNITSACEFASVPVFWQPNLSVSANKYPKRR
jgi:protein gp37